MSALRCPTPSFVGDGRFQRALAVSKLDVDVGGHVLDSAKIGFRRGKGRWDECVRLVHCCARKTLLAMYIERCCSSLLSHHASDLSIITMYTPSLPSPIPGLAHSSAQYACPAP